MQSHLDAFEKKKKIKRQSQEQGSFKSISGSVFMQPQLLEHKCWRNLTL